MNLFFMISALVVGVSLHAMQPGLPVPSARRTEKKIEGKVVAEYYLPFESTFHNAIPIKLGERFGLNLGFRVLEEIAAESWHINAANSRNLSLLKVCEHTFVQDLLRIEGKVGSSKFIFQALAVGMVAVQFKNKIAQISGIKEVLISITE